MSRNTDCRWKNSGISDGALRPLSGIDRAGYLPDVQADLLEDLSTRVVVPLIPHSGKIRPVRKLNPIFNIDGKPYAMFTHLIAAVPLVRLREPRTNLLPHHDEIVAAPDMLFQGF